MNATFKKAAYHTKTVKFRSAGEGCTEIILPNGEVMYYDNEKAASLAERLIQDHWVQVA